MCRNVNSTDSTNIEQWVLWAGSSKVCDTTTSLDLSEDVCSFFKKTFNVLLLHILKMAPAAQSGPSYVAVGCGSHILFCSRLNCCSRNTEGIFSFCFFVSKSNIWKINGGSTSREKTCWYDSDEQPSCCTNSLSNLLISTAALICVLVADSLQVKPSSLSVFLIHPGHLIICTNCTIISCLSSYTT